MTNELFYVYEEDDGYISCGQSIDLSQGCNIIATFESMKLAKEYCEELNKVYDDKYYKSKRGKDISRLQYNVNKKTYDKIKELQKEHQQSGAEIIENIVLKFEFIEEISERFDKIESMIKSLENKINKGDVDI